MTDQFVMLTSSSEGQIKGNNNVTSHIMDTMSLSKDMHVRTLGGNWSVHKVCQLLWVV